MQYRRLAGGLGSVKVGTRRAARGGWLRNSCRSASRLPSHAGLRQCSPYAAWRPLSNSHAQASVLALQLSGPIVPFHVSRVPMLSSSRQSFHCAACDGIIMLIIKDYLSWTRCFGGSEAIYNCFSVYETLRLDSLFCGWEMSRINPPSSNSSHDSMRESRPGSIGFSCTFSQLPCLHLSTYFYINGGGSR